MKVPIIVAASVAGVITTVAGAIDKISVEGMVLVGGGIVFAFAGIMGRQIIADVRTTRDTVVKADLPQLRVEMKAVDDRVDARYADLMNAIEKHTNATTVAMADTQLKQVVHGEKIAAVVQRVDHLESQIGRRAEPRASS